MTIGIQQQQREERPLPTKATDRYQATQRLSEEMERVKRDSSYQFSILLVELAGLSESTARLGYASGEDSSRRAAAFLTQDLAPQDLCCRLSSDEFLLILSGRGHDHAPRLADRLRRRWHPGNGTRDAEITLSVGIASYPRHGCRIADLLRAADEALDADRLHNDLLRAAADWEPALPETSPE